MARRSGLGKGLSSLIPPAESRAVRRRTAGDGRYLADIPVGRSRPNPHQPRVHFDEESLAELAASIAEIGVLQPILVRPSPTTGYELIAGERRWRAARRGRAGDDPGDRADDRRPRRRRAGAGREPPPPGPHSARGGGRLPAADRGLRADPRAGRRAGRQEPLGDHQHAAAARPAAGGPAPARRRQAVRRPRPGAARHARPSVAGAARPPSGRARAGRCARSRRPSATAACCRPTSPTPDRRPTPAEPDRSTVPA